MKRIIYSLLLLFFLFVFSCKKDSQEQKQSSEYNCDHAFAKSVGDFFKNVDNYNAGKIAKSDEYYSIDEAIYLLDGTFNTYYSFADAVYQKQYLKYQTHPFQKVFRLNY